MKRKGRRPMLSEQEMEIIRREYQRWSHRSGNILAKRFGCSQRTIRRVGNDPNYPKYRSSDYNPSKELEVVPISSETGE